MADTVVGDLVARLRADTTDFTSGLDAAEGKTKSFATGMESLGRKMTVGLTLPLMAVGAFSVKAASDLEESQNKVQVVFGDSAKSIERWAEDSARAFGMSRQAAFEAVGTFGNLFRSMDIGLPTAAKMSKQLVELAADLASFNNANPEEVLIALRSGLVGEIEPLRKFGVSLSAARVEAKAMELGLWDGVDAISASAKAQAAYAIILEDTTLAQGDFARTSDSAANRMRIAKAELSNAAAALGAVLLPIVAKAIGAFADFAEFLSRLPGPVRTLVVVLGLFVAVAGPAIYVTSALATAYMELALSAPAAAAGVRTLAVAIGTAILAAAAFTAAFIATTYVLEQVFGKARDLGAELDDLRESAAALTAVTEDQMVGAFQKLMLQYARTHENAAGLTITLGAFEEVAKSNIGTAIRLAEQYRSNTTVYNMMQGAINRVAEEQARLNIDTQNGANAVSDAEGRIRSQTGALDAQAVAYIRASEAARMFSAAQNLGAGFGYVPDDMYYPPGFADGGMVPGPVGAPMMAVVHGGEMILNPEQQAGMMGGGFNLTQYIYTSDPLSAGMESVRRMRAEAYLSGVA